MEKLILVGEDAKKALKTLEEMIEQPFSIIVRDAAIQRFEYSFEIFWKFVKQYMRDKGFLFFSQTFLWVNKSRELSFNVYLKLSVQ